MLLYQGKYATAGICRDISQRMELEQRVREAENLAQIGQLRASLAHEIRNPLSSIKMSIQMLLKTASLDETGVRTAEISAKEIARLERLFDQMLDLAKPTVLHCEEVYINSLIFSCIETLNSELSAKDILLETKLSQQIKPLFLDREKMEQVMINVLRNAVEALSSHGKISITTKQRRTPERGVGIEIADNGPGVKKADLQHIFDPFFSKKKKGIGLGLANVKKIVEAHGGEVDAISKRKGLRMTISLPAKTAR
jgi:signal transduction histidine kinase